MKITVITVCLNVKESIKRTMESVLQQTYSDLEYIIQDGGSTDGTLDIIREYQKEYPISLYSETDSGLYNAMNRATKKATGDYVIFMNSNDVFYSKDAIERMVPFLEEDIVFGNVVRIFEDGEHLETYQGKHKVFKLLMMGKMPSHQSIFTKTSVMKEMQFQEKYSITADFDFLVRCCKMKRSIRYADVTVSKVENIEGISSQTDNLWKMRKQDDESLKENYPLCYYMMKPIKAIKRNFL